MDERSAVPGTFESVLLLGRGGMGSVHLARSVGEAGFERLVVVKRMHEHLVADEKAVRRFLDEARIAAQLHHANVVGIQQVGYDDEGPFLVLDYVEGDSLEGLVRRAVAVDEKLPARIVAKVLLDALTGLHAAHVAEDATGRPLRVLHRDVSPQNILVGRDGIGRLTDFGIARDATAAPTTGPGKLAGKPLFMPPEYLRREPVDARLDVYAMGMTAWVALAGREPWPGASEAQIVLSVMDEGVPSLASVAPDVPGDVVEVVGRALAPDPVARYGTAREMATALAAGAQRTCGVAAQEEVASLVQRLAGVDLGERRRALREHVSARPPDVASVEERTPEAAREPEIPVEITYADLRPRPAPLHAGRAIAIGAVVAGLGIVVFGLAHGRPPASPPSAATPEMAPPPPRTTVAVAHPEPELPPPPPALSASSAPAVRTAPPHASRPSASPAPSPTAAAPATVAPGPKPLDGISATNPYR